MKNIIAAVICCVLLAWAFSAFSQGNPLGGPRGNIFYKETMDSGRLTYKEIELSGIMYVIEHLSMKDSSLCVSVFAKFFDTEGKKVLWPIDEFVIAKGASKPVFAVWENKAFVFAWFLDGDKSYITKLIPLELKEK